MVPTNLAGWTHICLCMSFLSVCACESVSVVSSAVSSVELGEGWDLE